MMLPVSLRQWASMLELLPEDIASGLAGWLHPIDNLLGRVEDMPFATQGELDGYDGLARRGPAERMLTSEWLLATEAPDEWSRRAAESELAYLNPNFRRPQTHSVTAALFDCGPDVFGTPRLAQLAALLVLARRAHAAGAQFLWGVLQTPVTELRRDVTSEDIYWLLQQRAPLPPSAAEVETWLGEMAEAGDTFLVGGESLREIQLPAGAALLIEDPLQDPAECGRELHLRARRYPAASRGPDRELRLSLPPDDWCTRVLENPAAVERNPSARLRRCSRHAAIRPEMLWLSPTTLAARSRQDEETLVIFRMPHSEHGELSKPKLHRLIWGKDTSYLGAVGTCLLVGRRVDTGIEVFPLSRKGRGVSVGTFVCSPEPAGATEGTQPLRPLIALGADSRVFAELYAGNVSMLVPDETQGVSSNPRQTTKTVAVNVLAWGPVSASVRCFTSGFSDEISLITSDGKVTEYPAPNNGSQYQVPGGKAMWGPVVGQPLGAGAAIWTDSVLALSVGDHNWRAWFQEGEALEQCALHSEGRQVYGVAFVRGSWQSPALICRDRAGRIMELRGSGWNRVIGSELEPILGAAQHPSSPLLAWCTATTLVTYSLTTGAEVARWEWGALT